MAELGAKDPPRPLKEAEKRNKAHGTGSRRGLSLGSEAPDDLHDPF